jgi:uncharacterized membrane protein (DUF4010 family)
MHDFFVSVLFSIAAGALIGLERQHSYPHGVIGLRTFTLLSLLGMLLTYYSVEQVLPFSDYLPAVGFLGVVAFAVMYYYFKAEYEESYGLTTALMIPLTFVFGALIGLGRFTESALVVVVIAGLLLEKKRVHAIVARFTHREIIDLLIFAIIAFVVYPLIPAEPIILFGQEINLNYFWTAVVFVSLLSFGAHILVKFLREKGILFAGFFGGMVSAIATIAVFLKKAKSGDYPLMRLIFILASIGSLTADLIVVALINQAFFYRVLPLVSALLAVFAVFAFFYAHKTTGLRKSVEVTEPISLKFVFEFAIIFFAVSLIINYAKNSALGLVVSALVGGVISLTAVFTTLAFLYPAVPATELVPALFAAIIAGWVAKLLLVFSKVDSKHASKFAPLIVAGLVAGAVALIYA